MILHYLKISFRNLLKYKIQSIVSILGLAVGFICFALSSLWIRYELTYDSFHKDSDRIYYVRQEDKLNAMGVSSITPEPLAALLKETFPEIEAAGNTQGSGESEYKIDGIDHKLKVLSVDSAFISLFPIEIIEGSTEFLREINKYAICQSQAEKLFGNENAIGKTIYQRRREITICAIVKDWPNHTNMPFDLLMTNGDVTQWGAYSSKTFIKVRKEINLSDFTSKIFEQELKGGENTTVTHLNLTPITKMRYDRPQSYADVAVRFNHVFLFVIASFLVIFCALYNYMTLFVSRVRMRVKEMALRKVNGSSNAGLFYAFSTDLLITLSFAMLVGMVLLEVVLPSFRKLSGVYTSREGIYGETLLYILIIIAVSILIAQIPIYYLKKSSLHVSMRENSSGAKKNLFRKISISFQLIISMGLIFCTIVMIKQIHYLINTDLGMERKNIASFSGYQTVDSKISKDKISQFPMVKEALIVGSPLIPETFIISFNVDEWDGKAADEKPKTIKGIGGSKEFCDFYGLTLLDGRMLMDGDDKNWNVLINQKAAKMFGWSDPVGKKYDNLYTVVGLVKDFYNLSPVTPSKPIVIRLSGDTEDYYSYSSTVIFKFEDNTWQECKSLIEQWMEKDYPDGVYGLVNSEEEYAKYVESENSLIKLLGFVSIVCILIAIFGIFSLVTLTCEQRRREIAIRKVNGASIGDILTIFFKEYFILLAISSIIAFPVGYAIMKRWLEDYVKQTEISTWIYLAILSGILLVIIISVGSRVWKAARENPAEVIKSE